MRGLSSSEIICKHSFTSQSRAGSSFFALISSCVQCFFLGVHGIVCCDKKVRCVSQVFKYYKCSDEDFFRGACFSLVENLGGHIIVVDVVQGYVRAFQV